MKYKKFIFHALWSTAVLFIIVRLYHYTDSTRMDVEKYLLTNKELIEIVGMNPTLTLTNKIHVFSGTTIKGKETPEYFEYHYIVRSEKSEKILVDVRVDDLDQDGKNEYHIIYRNNKS